MTDSGKSQWGSGHHLFMSHFNRILAVVMLACSPWLAAQGPSISSAAVEKRVDFLLSQMTIEEKIAIIGGTNTFYTQPIPRLGIPAMKMSDGPLGVHDYRPTTAYPAGIAIAASWDVDLAEQLRMALPV